MELVARNRHIIACFSIVFRIPGESAEAVESLPVNWMEEEGGECCVRGKSGLPVLCPW